MTRRDFMCILAAALCVLLAPLATAQISELIPPAARDSLDSLDRRTGRGKERQRQLARLAEGRRRWRRAGVHEYVLQTHYAPSGLPAPQGAIVAPVAVLHRVRNGVVIERERGKLMDAVDGPWTIDTLFHFVEQDMRDRGRVVMRLELHPKYGFPLHYHGETPGIADAGTFFDVDSFAIVQPTREPALTRGDSALVGRMLLAEDRRDSSDAALAEGARQRDPRLRALAQRARIRIRDAKAAGRDSLAALRPPLIWPEIWWKYAYRDARAPSGDCAKLRQLMHFGSWQVQLRASDVITAACAPDDSIATVLRAWIDSLPADASRRDSGGVSWHAAAHAAVALARMRPVEAGPRVRTLASHTQWQVRVYAARAAAVLADTATLRTLARDPNDNVKEAAIDALSKLTGHADDALYLAALGANGAQAVRAAAIALKRSPRSDVAAAANATFERWVLHANASERDARVALLETAGRPASDDRPPAPTYELPPRAVALALGADVKLRVRIAKESGGGSFVVRLRGDVAPIMAARILALARAHYYDGLDWHRVEPDFVIQGGSPGRNEYVGHPRYLRDELGTVPHLRGTVGMSTRGHDTGDAQWFV
ncbi:MAG TPA: peptidylprolyl isomerase, partial [Gemmatimonadaceae bacterium]|nr:peptidylprolyl isomerase [Gemmatimonadaceae bacterium]